MFLLPRDSSLSWTIIFILVDYKDSGWSVVRLSTASRLKMYLPRTIIRLWESDCSVLYHGCYSKREENVLFFVYTVESLCIQYCLFERVSLRELLVDRLSICFKTLPTHNTCVIPCNYRFIQIIASLRATESNSRIKPIFFDENK